MPEQRGLPGHLKLILVAALFTVVVAALVFGGFLITGSRLDHSNAEFAMVPVMVAVLAGVFCLLSLPGAVIALVRRSDARSVGSFSILAVGVVMAVIPIAVFAFLFRG